MMTFAIRGRCIAAPPAADWREQLARELGAKPRRIGVWAELGLYGALRCMEAAHETTLPQDALLMLASRRGTYVATDMVLAQMRDDLPMPLAFLQTQPSQMLALLAAQLNWQGHASFVAGTEPQAVLQLAAAQAGAGGVLLGWVDEMDGGSTNWLRLHRSAQETGEFVPALFNEIFSPEVSHLHMAGATLLVRFAGQASLGEQVAKW
jgi:hypothetical protein